MTGQDELVRPADAAREARVLRAALLWARNHLEVGSQDIRDDVILTLDRVLKHREPTIADMKLFRETYAARSDSAVVRRSRKDIAGELAQADQVE